VEDLDYARVGNGVELALCETCLRDYLEWRGLWAVGGGPLHRKAYIPVAEIGRALYV